MELYLINNGGSYYELYSKKRITARLEEIKEETQEQKGFFSRILDFDIVDKIESAEKYVNNKVLDRFPKLKKVNSYGPKMVRAYRDFMVGSHGQIFLDIISKRQQIDIYHSPSIDEKVAKYAYLRLVRREIIRQSYLCVLSLPIAAFTAVLPPPGFVTPAIFLALSLYGVKTALSARRSKNYLSFKVNQGLGILEDVIAGKIPPEQIDDPNLLEYYGKRKVPKNKK